MRKLPVVEYHRPQRAAERMAAHERIAAKLAQNIDAAEEHIDCDRTDILIAARGTR